MSQWQGSGIVGEDSEHMAGWTVGRESGVDAVLEFIELRKNASTSSCSIDIPQVIECRFQPTLFKSIRSLSTTTGSCGRGGPGTMRERRSSAESGRRLHETRDMPSPRVITRRHRSHSADGDGLVGLRLALAGFQPAGGVLSRQSSRPTSSNDDALLDELHSDPYSLVIEKLRLQLSDCLPAIDEEMISKAVINAFSTYPSSDDDELYTDKLQIEVELLCKAFQWIQIHSGASDESAQQEFLQQCLDKVFLQIRRQHLASSSRALRIILNVCSILGLEIDDSVHLPNDTVILQGLLGRATRKELYESLSAFGPINAIAISTEFPGFAFCRFDDEASAHRVVKNRNAIAFGGSLIGATMLGEISLFRQPVSPESLQRRKCGATKDIFEIIPACMSKHTGRLSNDHQEDTVFAADYLTPLSFRS